MAKTAWDTGANEQEKSASLQLLRQAHLESQKIHFRYGLTDFQMPDSLKYAGFGFLMFGMLMGCVWAKDAWGHY